MEQLKNVVREPSVAEPKSWKTIHATAKEPMVIGLGTVDIPESALADNHPPQITRISRQPE